MDLVVEPLTESVVYDMGSEDSRPLGTMATYTCSTGYSYMVVGSVTVTCLVDRTWSDNTTCECEYGNRWLNCVHVSNILHSGLSGPC